MKLVCLFQFNPLVFNNVPLNTLPQTLINIGQTLFSDFSQMTSHSPTPPRVKSQFHRAYDSTGRPPKSTSGLYEASISTLLDIKRL